MTRLSILHILALLTLTIDTITSEPPIPTLLDANGTELEPTEQTTANGTTIPFWVGNRTNEEIYEDDETTTSTEGMKGAVTIKPTGTALISKKTKANLTKCNEHDTKMICYAGNGCVEGTRKKQKSLIRLDHTDVLWRMNMDPVLRERIEICSVGFTMTPAETNGTLYYFEYHSKTKYFSIPIIVTDDTDQRYIEIDKGGNLICGPACDIYEDTRKVYKKDYYYWSGNFTLRSVIKRTRLEECYTNKKMICYVGRHCISGIRDGKHEGIDHLSTEIMRLLNGIENRKDATMECNVGASLTLKKAGRYKMDYHTTFDNAQLILKIHGVNRSVKIEKDRTLSCSPGCEFTQNKRDTGGRYWWSGDIVFWPLTASDVAEEQEKSKQALSPGGEDGRMFESAYPNIGTIIMGCLGALVACVIIAVVVGTVIQRRQAARNKRKREQITAAVNPKRKSVEERNNAQLDPFLPKDQTTQTCNDISDSVKSEKTVIEN